MTGGIEVNEQGEIPQRKVYGFTRDFRTASTLAALVPDAAALGPLVDVLNAQQRATMERLEAEEQRREAERQVLQKTPNLAAAAALMLDGRADKRLLFLAALEDVMQTMMRENDEYRANPRLCKKHAVKALKRSMR